MRTLVALPSAHPRGRQPAETRRDYPLKTELPDDLPRGSDDLPIVSRPVPVAVSVGPEDLARVLNERGEIVFFIDGLFVFENEVGFLPMSWTWDPRGANPGRHYITANIRGYGGHFGMGTIEVPVEGSEGSMR
jgi:hypothetical protein